MRPVGTQSRFTTPWSGDFFQLFQLSKFITAPLRKRDRLRKSHLALNWQGALCPLMTHSGHLVSPNYRRPLGNLYSTSMCRPVKVLQKAAPRDLRPEYRGPTADSLENVGSAGARVYNARSHSELLELVFYRFH
jgi:hypothetical protein